MIKKLRVTVDGKPYDVTVEVPDESDGARASLPLPAARARRLPARRLRRRPGASSAAASAGAGQRRAAPVPVMCQARWPAGSSPSSAKPARRLRKTTLAHARSHEDEHIRLCPQGRQSR